MRPNNRTIKDKVLLRTKLSNKEVFLRSDFSTIADYDQVGRALKQLVESGDLVKIGQGIYTSARNNSVTGEPTIGIPGGFKRAVRLALERLNVRYTYTSATIDYNNRKSTQIPANLELLVEKGFTRKIQFRKLKANLIPVKGSTLSAR